MINKKSQYNCLGLEVHIDVKLTSNVSLEQLFVGAYFSLLLVHSGSFTIQVKDSKIHLSSNELVVLPKMAFCQIFGMSNQFRISLVSFSSAFIFENSIKRPYAGYFEFFVTKVPTKISLRSKDLALLIGLFKLIDSKIRISKKHIFKNEVMLFSFNLLLYELAEIYNRYAVNIKVRHSRKETIVMQFFSILEINCKRQHGVKFYADALFITTGHLTKTVKQVTQKSTKQFIEEALILEAKILLQNEHLTILEIVEELRFSNASFFSNFFKKFTAVSPSVYRFKFNINSVV